MSNTLGSMEGVQRLKVDLFTEGLGIDQETQAALAESDAPITLADYASTSGVTLKLPGDIWVNAPFTAHNPNFVDSPDHHLVLRDGQPTIIAPNETEYPVEFIPVPDYHDKKLKDGSPITNIAITHSDRVRISPVKGCAIQCNFCDIPFDREPGEPRYRGPKNIANILEATGIALGDPQLEAQHILISGGTPRKQDYSYENEVYEQMAAAYPGVDVDIMMVPMPELLDAKRLGAIGINGLSINLELYNKEIALATMRSKAKASRELYFDFIEEAAEVFGPGNVRSLLMVGIEPIEDTLKGVEELAKRGCDPVLSPFRPDPITPLRDMKPSTAIELLEVWKRSQEIIEKYPGVKLGPRCVPCMHNTLTFPDGSDTYYHSTKATQE